MIPRTIIGVYLIRNTVNGAGYVGSSRKSIYERWLRHIKALRENRHDNQWLQRAWNKYGEAAFEIVVHEEVSDADKVLAREQHWIDWFLARDPEQCYNLSRKAYGGGPREWTPEQKRRFSERQMGHAVSQETREKLSKANSGRLLSEEHCKKLSESHKGFKPTKEAVRKRADAIRGRSRARITYEGVISPDGQEHRDISDLKRFALARGLDYGSLLRVAKGQQFAHRGWRKLGTVSRSYDFIGPDGTEYRHIQSLEAFCREHGLTHDCMRLVYVGSQPHHRGWRCIGSEVTGYRFISPDGVVYGNIWHLTRFCREHGLLPSAMCMVHAGQKAHYKGWRKG